MSGLGGGWFSRGIIRAGNPRLRSLPNRNRVEAVIHAAERRRALVLAVEQAAVAVAVLLAGVILLLLLGTEALNWYWQALIGAIALGAAMWRRARPRMQRYRLAQILDRRLNLSDSLSTAWFLLTESKRDDAFARLQLAHAEAVARTVRPARAFPFSGRRKWAVSAALAAAACGLFSVRYLVTGSLRLEQALAPLHLAPTFEAVEETASGAKLKRTGVLAAGERGELARAAQSQQQEDKSRASTPEEAKPGDPAGAAAAAARAQSGSTRQDAIETGEDKAPNGQASNSEAAQQNGADATQQQSAGARQERTSSQQASSSVLDKMRDALSSLMAKMRASTSADQRAAREGERSEASQRAGDQTAAGQDQQGSRTNATGTQASEQQSAQGQAQGQTTEQTQSAQGRNADGGDRKGAGSQSGAGHQDGDKAIKEAEQQQAMGKLAEIIGKRSASLTGDMTVETRGGKQQLKTEYSQRMGQHSDLGGVINRDEIPIEYQQYIRDYMEAVRKQRPQ